MGIDVLHTRIRTLNQDVAVRVMVPGEYEAGDSRYPVLYINDGQDVFRDEDSFWGSESLRFEQYYRDFGKFLPRVILVAIESSKDHAQRTAQYSPYSKDFVVPAGKNFESHIEGKGKAYLDWVTGELKAMIDARYRTLPGPEHTGICGYSTGGLNAIYAIMNYPHIFSRIIAMSAAVYIWMDKLEETLAAGDFDHIRFMYLDVGTNEFGRMTTKEEFLEGTKMVYQYFSTRMKEKGRLNYKVFTDAIHNQREWRMRFPDAIRWIFQDQ